MHEWLRLEICRTIWGEVVKPRFASSQARCAERHPEAHFLAKAYELSARAQRADSQRTRLRAEARARDSSWSVQAYICMRRMLAVRVASNSSSGSCTVQPAMKSMLQHHMNALGQNPRFHSIAMQHCGCPWSRLLAAHEQIHKAYCLQPWSWRKQRLGLQRDNTGAERMNAQQLVSAMCTAKHSALQAPMLQWQWENNKHCLKAKAWTHCETLRGSRLCKETCTSRIGLCIGADQYAMSAAKQTHASWALSKQPYCHQVNLTDF